MLFRSEQNVDLSTGIALSDFPAYIRPTTITPDLQKLLAMGQERRQQSQSLRKKQSESQAYLFKFGGNSAQVLTEDIGRERPYQNVSFEDTFAKRKSFGFSTPVGQRGPRHWIQSDLDKTQLFVAKEQNFHVAIKPGRYTLRLSLTSGVAGNVILKGAGHSNPIPFPLGDSVISVDVDVTDSELTISTDQTLGWCWLTVVERPN